LHRSPDFIQEAVRGRQFTVFKVDYEGGLPIDTVWALIHTDDYQSHFKLKSFIVMSRDDMEITVTPHDSIFSFPYTITEYDWSNNRIRINAVKVVNTFIKAEIKDIQNSYNYELKQKDIYEIRSRESEFSAGHHIW